VVAVPPPRITSVPPPSCPIENRGAAEVPARVSAAVPPLPMIARSADVGAVPLLQLLPVAKLPEPDTIHDTSAASTRPSAATAARQRTTPKTVPRRNDMHMTATDDRPLLEWQP